MGGIDAVQSHFSNPFKLGSLQLIRSIRLSVALFQRNAANCPFGPAMYQCRSRGA